MNQEKNNQESIDLSGMLKDSEARPKAGQEESTHFIRPGTPKIIQWLIKYSGGLIKNEKQASYLIFGFIAVAIIISLFLVFGGYGVRPKETFVPPPADAPIEELIPPAF